MNCRKVSRWFSAYIEGDLLPPRATQVDEHIGHCCQCREKIADLRLIVKTASELESHQPGAYFSNRVLCAVNAQDQPMEILSSWKFKLILSGMAFVVAACITLFVVGPNTANLSVPSPRGNAAIPMANMTKGTPTTSVATGGFPVPQEALKRDMALTESPKADTSHSDTVILPRNYMQQVELNKGN